MSEPGAMRDFLMSEPEGRPLVSSKAAMHQTKDSPDSSQGQLEEESLYSSL